MTLHERKTILLVEDEIIIALSEAETIRGSGYDVLTVHSGSKAIDSALENSGISLILMDIDLGKGMDGTEAARRILEKRNLPIVFLTSHSEREMVDRVRGITRYGYVIKNSGDFVLQSSIEMAYELFDANKKTEEREQTYRSLFENLINGFAYCKMCFEGDRPVDFIYLAVNEAFSAQTGLQDVVGKKVSEVLPGIRENDPALLETYGRVARTGKPEQFEFFLESLKMWLMLSVYSPERDHFVAIFDVIDERKNDELVHLATIELLKMINAASSKQDLMRSVTAFLKQWLKCDAIGIRLKEKDDFPYCETKGFPATFVEAERYLCSHDARGEIVRDSTGNPALECMCGNILRQRFDPAKAFFTPHGSFWSNCTTELLASTTEADRQARTRNRCNGEGYESVGLFPLRLGTETFGLLQVNHKQKGLFTPRILSLLEYFGDNLAIAMAHMRMEDDFRRLNERISTATRAAGVGIWDWDVVNNRLVWDDQMYALYGIRKEAFAGAYEAWQSVLHPDDRAASEEESQQALSGVREYDTEFRVVWPDASVHYIKAKAEVFRKQDGTPLRMIGVNYDITSRRQTEEALKASEKRFHSLYYHMVEGVALHQLVYDDRGHPEDYVIVEVNPAFERILGISRDSAIGKSSRELYGVAEPPYLALYAGVASTGEPRVFETFHSEFGRHFSISAYCPQPGYFATIFEDISASRQAEQSLAESESKYRMLSENIKDVIWIMDPVTMRFLYMSPSVATLRGYTAEEVLSQPVDAALTPEGKLYLQGIVSKRVEEFLGDNETPGRFYTDEIEQPCNDGSLVWTEVITNYYRNAQTGRIEVRGVTRDITMRKRDADQIKSLLAEKELLLKEVHHRIKNNMNSVRGLLSLQASSIQDTTARAALKNAEDRVRSMMLLYDKLFRSNRFNEAPIDEYLSSLVDDIVANFPNRDSVTITKHLAGFPVDARRLSPIGMIINELVSNTMKYAFAGGRKGMIFLSTTLQNNHATIVVKDDGVGIPLSLDVHSSPGFGLHLVDVLTKQLDATIRLEREGGTTWVLEFDVSPIHSGVRSSS